jgi:hypothetical protein
MGHCCLLCHRPHWPYILRFNVNNCPTRCELAQFLFPANCSTCFGWHLRPSSWARVNCSYSIWHWSNSMLPSAVVEVITLLALLMIGEGITRNMYSSLQRIKTVLNRILLNSYWHWFTMHGPMNIKNIKFWDLFLFLYFHLTIINGAVVCYALGPGGIWNIPSLQRYIKLVYTCC